MAAGEEREDCARDGAACLSRLYLEDGECILTADATAENRVWLAARFLGKRVTLAAAADVRASILRRFGEDLKHEAAEELARRTPELSASQVLSQFQIMVFSALAILCGLAAPPPAPVPAAKPATLAPGS